MTERPNVLWICTDQQRFDTIGALGWPGVSTPVIDRLVADGMAFTHAYCQSPICTPSRGSFLTGCYPSRVHSPRNGNSHFPESAPPLITRLFADEGYHCGNVGKFHLASNFERMEPRADDGYAEYYHSHAPRDDWPEGHDYADWVRKKGSVLADLIEDVDGVPPELHQTTWAADRTIDFVRRNKGVPWLVTVNIYDPHPPFNPPKTYRDMFNSADMPGPHFEPGDIAAQEALDAVDFQSRARDPSELDINHPIIAKGLARGEGEAPGSSAGGRDARTLIAAYYAMIKLIDDQVGRILAALAECGQRENTIVLFMSDHGEMLGDHGLIQKGCRFYEGLVRVPMIWSWPGRIGSGKISHELAELTDIAPTLLDLADLPAAEHMQGLTLAPVLAGASDRHRDHVRSEYIDALDLPDASIATMYRDRRFKLVSYHRQGIGELFDLENDPWEHRNLWNDPAYAAERARLTEASFDATMLAADLGPSRIGPM